MRGIARFALSLENLDIGLYENLWYNTHFNFIRFSKRNQGMRLLRRLLKKRAVAPLVPLREAEKLNRVCT
jgi:hypothetical protein